MGCKIREKREEQHISQTKLAQLSGVSRARINALETGKAKNVKASTLIKIANALQTTVDCIYF
ncbi:MAG: helix-turn-helix transcriptional regulator [Clostridia bacterium]|nr:helix-turn-helix transcriptional regulator [Clostridia bacterium]